VDVGAAQVLAFRVAGHGLAAAGDDPWAPLRGWAVQDSPPGTAAAAVLARTTAVEPGWLEAALERRDAVALWNPRTATAVLAAADAAAYATALLPRDEAGIKAIAKPALPDRSDGFGDAVALAVAAVADALDGAVLSRDDLHEALRRRLPPDLLPWCKGCQSHHARRGLLVLAGLHGRLCHAGRAGRQPAFARTDQWVGWDPPAPEAAGAELMRRYLSAYGPSTPAHFAAWAGLGAAHAKGLWGAVAGELAEVSLDGAGRAWAPERDLATLQDPPPAPGVRLLASGDPLLLGRDREGLIADPALRAQVWRAIGGAGVVLADGVPAAAWRARKEGRRLDVEVQAFGTLDGAALQEAAMRLAPHRGCATAQVVGLDGP